MTSSSAVDNSDQANSIHFLPSFSIQILATVCPRWEFLCPRLTIWIWRLLLFQGMQRILLLIFSVSHSLFSAHIFNTFHFFYESMCSFTIENRRFFERSSHILSSKLNVCTYTCKNTINILKSQSFWKFSYVNKAKIMILYKLGIVLYNKSLDFL